MIFTRWRIPATAPPVTLIRSSLDCENKRCFDALVLGARMAEELRDFAIAAAECGSPMPVVSGLLKEWDEFFTRATGGNQRCNHDATQTDGKNTA